VWIDYFRGTSTRESDKLNSLLGTEPVAIGDLILTEVLQGFSTERDFDQARKLLISLEVVALVGEDIAIKAAKNFRTLRAAGITVRKTIGTIIATHCIENNHALLFSDRDFEPFVRHLGLHSVLVTS
jgi:predicted nucleic acid-binding protein